MFYILLNSISIFSGFFIGKKVGDYVDSTARVGNLIVGFLLIFLGGKMMFNLKAELQTLLLVGLCITSYLLCSAIIPKINFLKISISKNHEVDKKPASNIRDITDLSLLFCLGPVAFLGALEICHTGSGSIYIVKSIADGVISTLLSKSYHTKQVFISSVIVFLFQFSLVIIFRVMNIDSVDYLLEKLFFFGGVALILIGLNSAFKMNFSAARILPGAVISFLVSI